MTTFLIVVEVSSGFRKCFHEKALRIDPEYNGVIRIDGCDLEIVDGRELSSILTDQIRSTPSNAKLKLLRAVMTLNKS
jgi:hypothetical protein